jgi:hypothetical protein
MCKPTSKFYRAVNWGKPRIGQGDIALSVAVSVDNVRPRLIIRRLAVLMLVAVMGRVFLP